MSMFAPITASLKDSIAKFESHFEQYTNAEAAAAEQIVTEHHQNVLQFREAEKNLREREGAVRKAKETEELKLKDALLRHATVRDELNALTAQLAALPAQIDAAQNAQTAKADALQHKQIDVDKERSAFAVKLEALLGAVATYAQRLGLTIATTAKGLSFTFTHIDARNPQRKFELLLGFGENKEIKILSTTPAIDTAELDEEVDWQDMACFGYVVQWTRRKFRDFVRNPPAPARAAAAAAALAAPSPAKAAKTPTKQRGAAAAAQGMTVSAAFAAMSVDAKAAAPAPTPVPAAAAVAAAAAPIASATASEAAAAAAEPAAEPGAEVLAEAIASPVKGADGGMPVLSYPVPAWYS